MCVSLLRAFIPFSTNVKPLIMNDKADPKSVICTDSVKMRILNLLKPENIHEMSEEMENAILSILTQIVRDEPDYKIQIGKEFIKSAGNRIEALMRFCRYKATQDPASEKVKRPQLEAARDQISISDNIQFAPGNELKFFKLLLVLYKNSDDNIKMLKRVQQPLDDYLTNFVAGYCAKYKEEGNKQKGEQYELIRESLGQLKAHFD